MKPVEILKKAGRAGVSVAISHTDRIKVSGPQKRVDQFIPVLLDNKAALIMFLQQIPVEPALMSCPMCNSLNFIHGHRGGYYCMVCQPDARPGIPVKAGRYRPKPNKR